MASADDKRNEILQRVATETAAKMAALDAERAKNPPKPPRRGRKSKLDPAVQAKIVETLLATGTVEDAAQRAGVGLATLHNWKVKGLAQEKGPYRDFVIAVESALVERRLRREAIVEAAGRDKRDAQGKLIAAGDWRATAWIMERTEPKRYAPRVRVHVEEELNDVADELEEEFAEEPHILDRITAALARRNSGRAASTAPREAPTEDGGGGEAVQPGGSSTEPGSGTVPPA